MPTAHVGDGGTGAQAVGDPHGREPGVDEVGAVGRPEEPLAALVHVAAVLRPADPAPATYDVDEALAVGDGAEGDLEEAGEVRRAVGSSVRATACSGGSV